MASMLQKGDELRPKYNSFDFEKLDPTQLKWLGRMTLFSKYRAQILKRFEEIRVSSDMKILFIEQHSMKLGDAVFYSLEHAR